MGCSLSALPPISPRWFPLRSLESEFPLHIVDPAVDAERRETRVLRHTGVVPIGEAVLMRAQHATELVGKSIEQVDRSHAESQVLLHLVGDVQVREIGR